jgi:AIPR protein
LLSGFFFYDDLQIQTSFRNQHTAHDGRRLCVFTAPVANIPAEWEDWREVNVRDTNKRGEVFNAIMETLRNDPSEMIFRNLGITILSPKVEFDNKTDEVTVVFSDKTQHGIANGGHTFSAIREVLRTQAVDAEVKIECIVGKLETDVRVEIVDGRNRSRAAQAHSLENLRESYKPIEDVLTNPYYKDRIAYSEIELDDDGKRKDISIRELLSYIFALDVADRNNHPINAYRSKGFVVEHYASQDDKGRKRKEIIKRAAPILPDILRLRDVIYRDLPAAYNSTGGKFGLLETMGVAKFKEPRPLRFIEENSDFNYPDAFIYPILSGFRKHINHSGVWAWREDPFKIWEDKRKDVAAAIKDAIGVSANANVLGKSGATWRMCFDAI